MDADLDLLLTTVFCTADDLLPEKAENARRRVTDAEVVTLCVAQSIMDLPSDRRFLAVATKRLGHLFPELPKQPGFHKRRRRLAETIGVAHRHLLRPKPRPHRRRRLVGFDPGGVRPLGRDDEALRARRPLRLRLLRKPFRFFWGMRLHLACAPDGTPRGMALVSASRPEREVALQLLPEAISGGEALVCDKGYSGAEFAAEVERLGAFVFRPKRRDERGAGPHLAPIRQRVESVFWTCKDILGLERHGARTIEGLCERICWRILTLAACIASTTSSGVRAALWSTMSPEGVESTI